MISEELKTIIDTLNDQGKMAFLEGATEEQIAQFEKDHEIILPTKNKEWLQYSDGSEFFFTSRSATLWCCTQALDRYQG